MFMAVKEKPVCLLCGDSVSVTKEYNIRRHYETSPKHTDKDKLHEHIHVVTHIWTWNKRCRG